MQAAILTGVAGGIGAAIGKALVGSGRHVVGIDAQTPPLGSCSVHVMGDLVALAQGQDLASPLLRQIQDAVGDRDVSLLINNAAVQRLGRTEDLDWEAWNETIQVNLSAPFVLIQFFVASLRETKGLVVNVGSVHARATKPKFAAYATSKAALHGLTRALAVDLGPEIRVITLAPAAIETPMLLAGFDGDEKALEALREVHPAGRIGRPEEVAEAVLWLSDGGASFMTGSAIWLDGGVMARLHDVE